ncbi:hypothetical protein ABBQ38_011079 [Trebouxia sp. C0009 RCD-2024]
MRRRRKCAATEECPTVSASAAFTGQRGDKPAEVAFRPLPKDLGIGAFAASFRPFAQDQGSGAIEAAFSPFPQDQGNGAVEAAFGPLPQDHHSPGLMLPDTPQVSGPLVFTEEESRASATGRAETCVYRSQQGM